jgi:hypothetical protein
MKLPEGPLPSITSNQQDLLLMVANILTPPRFMHMQILTGLHVSKLAGHSVAFVFDWPVVLLPTNVNFNRLLRACQRKQNLWPHTTLAK